MGAYHLYVYSRRTHSTLKEQIMYWMGGKKKKKEKELAKQVLKREIIWTNFKNWKLILDGKSAHKALWEYSEKSLGIIKHFVSNPNIGSFDSTKRKNQANFWKQKWYMLYVVKLKKRTN